MRLMVQVQGHWVVGIERWDDTLEQRWRQWAFEQLGCSTRLERRANAQ